LKNFEHTGNIKSGKPIIYGFVFLFLLISSYGFSQAGNNTVNNVSHALNAGDAGALSRYFNATIDLTLPDNDGTYSNKQAEQLLKAFFRTNTVKSFTLDHQGNSNDGSRYLIGTLLCKSGKAFRVYSLIKKQGDDNLIHQLQIEKK
jgi:hypothetical protein